MAKIDKKKLSEEELSRYHRRRARQGLGAAVILLTVVGLATVVYGGVKGVIKLFDNSEEKTSYETLLAPLVMLDPLPFDDMAAANKDLLKEAAIWACTYNNDTSTYERDETVAMILPAIDVDRAAAKLYGPDFTVERATFSDSGMDFIYNEEKQGFIIPITGQVGVYTPKVFKIKGISEKTVTVGYISPYAGMMDGTGVKVSDEPVKYVDYVFARKDGVYYLTAVKDSEMKPKTSASSSASSSSEAVLNSDPEAALAQQQAQQDAAVNENNK